MKFCKEKTSNIYRISYGIVKLTLHSVSEFQNCFLVENENAIHRVTILGVLIRFVSSLYLKCGRMRDVCIFK